MRHALLLGSILILPGTSRAGATPAPDAVRAAVQRSLPYLEKEGLAWIEKRNCNSCHVVSFMLWSHNEAQARGIKVDAKKLSEWTSWSLNSSLELRQWFKLTEPSFKALQGDGVPEPLVEGLKPLVNKTFVTEKEFLDEACKGMKAEDAGRHQAALVKRARQAKKGAQNDGGGLDTVGQLLLAGGSSKEFLAAAPPLMEQWQENNGSWSAAGQLPSQKRPRPEADQATTGWAILALASLDRHDPAATKSLESALALFKKTKPGKSHETLLLHLLVEHKFGSTGTAQGLLEEVLSRQNADGGFGWLVGAGSDAFATGQTLYALQIAGVSSSDAVTRAQKYLLDTQTKDGMWVVPPQAVSSANNDSRVKKLVPIYNYWGSAWASIGLSRSLADLAVAAAGEADKAKQDLKKLEGTWRATALTYNGKDFLADGKGGFDFVFKGAEATIQGNDKVKKEYGKIRLKLDPSTTPKTVDITVTDGVQKDAVIEGIYELKDNELKICAKVFGNERPTEFASPEGSSVVLLVLRREDN